MPIIKLIVTGEMEKGALHKSLQKCFQTRPEEIAVEWPTPNKAYPATSARLRESKEPTEKMVELANIMIAEVLYSKTGKSPDLVLVIDDLELHNAGQEALVAQHFRLAIEKVIAKTEKYRTQEAKIRLLLRERCSFHLLKPMVEAYLFGDAAAFRTAATSKLAKLPAGLDLEEFETDDSSYLPQCHKINEQRKADFPDWREERHPKRYLLFLNPEYNETKEGKDALLMLNWATLTTNKAHLQVIRALLKDLSAWFGRDNPLPGESHPVFCPANNANNNKLTLRNL